MAQTCAALPKTARSFSRSSTRRSGDNRALLPCRPVRPMITDRTGEELAPLCDLCLRAPAEATQLFQQFHITAAHIICGLIEKALFPRDTSGNSCC